MCESSKNTTRINFKLNFAEHMITAFLKLLPANVSNQFVIMESSLDCIAVILSTLSHEIHSNFSPLDCDDKFRRCLVGLNTETANTLGAAFFNAIQVTCFDFRRPCSNLQR